LLITIYNNIKDRTNYENRTRNQRLRRGIEAEYRRIQEEGHTEEGLVWNTSDTRDGETETRTTILSRNITGISQATPKGDNEKQNFNQK
jgi:hypothetical protein